MNSTVASCPLIVVLSEIIYVTAVQTIFFYTVSKASMAWRCPPNNAGSCPLIVVLSEIHVAMHAALVILAYMALCCPPDNVFAKTATGSL